jgi:hypothetical protein
VFRFSDVVLLDAEAFCVGASQRNVFVLADGDDPQQ